VNDAPIIAIDGPSASGKGTVAANVAKALGFRYLDSGALYRLVTLAALRARANLDDEAALAAIAKGLRVEFRDGKTWLDGRDVTADVRTEEVSAAASKVAAQPAVRSALFDRQRRFRGHPGLVAEGRDMGSVVFPEAALKVYLTASVETRAERRYKQLIEKGMYAKIEDVVEELRRRDARDASRPVAPLRHYPDAVFLDTSDLSAEEAVDRILSLWRERAAGAGNSPQQA
jgi:cytidylate kinase